MGVVIKLWETLISITLICPIAAIIPHFMMMMIVDSKWSETKSLNLRGQRPNSSWLVFKTLEKPLFLTYLIILRTRLMLQKDSTPVN